jgi:hypothetical protein
VLDGQQRITSLYAIRKGIRITKDGEEIDYKDIYIDLDYESGVDEQVVVASQLPNRNYVSVFEILNRPLTSYLGVLPNDKIQLIEEYKNRLTTYNFSTIMIKEYPIDIACEVFTRINTGGRSLTLFEIMVAMTYDDKQDFDLAIKYNELVHGTDEDDRCLETAKFDTLPETTIMQAVAAVSIKSVRARDILKIGRQRFIDHWEMTRTSMFHAVDFFRAELRIPVSQLLPYPSLVVPITYFFYLIGNKKPSAIQNRLLDQFFYWVGLTGRYSGATETKLGEDLAKMELIAKGRSPRYPAGELEVPASDIEDTWFSASSSYCKAILCLFASNKPRSFDTDGDVLLDNSNLKIASSRNYHHFFPRDYVRKNYPDTDANWIANITLIDAYSNKHKIRAKPPKRYIGEFAKTNPHLKRSLRTHFIDDIETFGVTTNDFETFLSQRARAIADRLNAKLNPTLD